MTLGGKTLALVLVAIYVGAVWVRLDVLGDAVYPYYNGVSGTNFRHAQMIAQNGRLPDVDLRASQPEGYSPSRARPNGVEYFTGYTIRLVRPFTDASDRRVAGVLTVLVFSLSVFTMYALTRRVWDCQAAGGFVAFLVAFSAPLIAATSGREYLHAPYAFLVISAHLAFFAGVAAHPSVGRIVSAALSALVLLSLWSSAGLYLALFALAILILPGLSRGTRRWMLASHLAVVLVAGLVFPHLRADRFILDWPAAWLMVVTAYSFLAGRIPRRFPAWAYLPGVLIALTVLFSLWRDTGSGLLDPLVYWYHRIRFISGKPDDPSLLPGMVRVAWTEEHAPPPAGVLLAFFLPLLFVLIPALLALRAKVGKGVPLWPFITAAAIGSALFLIDAAAVFSAALVAFPFAAGAFRGFAKHLKTRALPAAAAVFLVAAGSPLLPPSLHVGRLTGGGFEAATTPRSGFLWASIGNADRELVRFLATRTSTRNDVVLAMPEISSLVVTFAGRSTVIVPGVETRSMTDKIVEVASGFYANELDLYERCRALGATYVAYSIDVFLDDSPYSPRYMSAAEGNVRSSVAYDMHFAAETLRHFQLVYENDNYRLFRVTAQTQPVFLSDHPPVYQEEVFLAFGGDRGAFYARILDVLATYHKAVEAQMMGDEEEAIRRFEYALGYVPRFTAARLGVGDSLFRLGKPGEAYEAYRFVLGYAPDDTHALYYGALSLAYIDRREEARHLVELLLTATADRETRMEALELKAALESGRPLEMPERPTPETPD